jgi:selenide,water dikinase
VLKDTAEPVRDVVLVGGGHSHVQVLRRFEMEPLAGARLTVVLDVPVAVYSGMVPGFVAGQYQADEIEIDVVPLARRARARVVMSAATGVDAKDKKILLADRPPIPYDVASLDIGSTVAGLDLPGIRQFALPTRPIAGFVRKVDALIDQAGKQRSGHLFRVAVVGAGAGGVELAFTLDERLRLAGATPEVTLLHSGPGILTGYPQSLVRRTEKNASARGIQIRCNTRVAAAEEHHAVLEDGSTLGYDALVWVTGAVSHDLLRDSGLPTDARGFVRTRSTLQVEGHDDLFAVGDCGSLIEYPETPKAGVYAVRQGPYVAENLRRHLLGEALKTYRPQHDFLTLLNLGDGSALGAKWGLSMEGPWVMRLKDRIDRAFMRKFQVLSFDGSPNQEFSAAASMDGQDDMLCGGCAAKLGQEPLARTLARLPLPAAEAAGDHVELGLSAPDDAAIWRTQGGAHVASSVDLFSAFTDDPFLVGRVAAINALSDLWATGVTPRIAHAIVSIPEHLGREESGEMLFQVLAGARRELDQVGVPLAGGHTTRSPEKLLIGFTVEGEVASGEFVRKGGLRPGNALILTKPLGSGVILYADMHGRVRGPWLRSAFESMLRSNHKAAVIAREAGVSGMTDITGFGLAGHLFEMLAASGVSAEVEIDSLPLLDGVHELFARGERSTLHPENARLSAVIESEEKLGNDDPALAALFDPQTSGGLLFGIDPRVAGRLVSTLHDGGDSSAAVIGRVNPPRSDGVRLRVV